MTTRTRLLLLSGGQVNFHHRRFAATMSRSTKHAIVAVTLTLLIGGGIVAGFFAFKLQPANLMPQAVAASPEPITKAPKDRPAVIISAHDLFASYGDNAAKADGNFKDKLINLVGCKGRITSTASGYRFSIDVVGRLLVDMPTFNRMTEKEKHNYNYGYPSNVLADFDKSEREAVAQIQPDKTYIIQGRCVGVKPDAAVFKGYVVLLDHCALIKADADDDEKPDPVPQKGKGPRKPQPGKKGS